MSSGQFTATDVSNDESRTRTAVFADAERALHGMQDIVGRKWNPVLLYYLLRDGPMGFSALKTEVDGISSKMLSESLSDLEEHGLVSRELLSDQPVRVEYELTDQGRSLEPVIVGMVQWGDEHGERE